jgi:hypothetical protein
VEYRRLLLEHGEVQVVRVVGEVAGEVSAKPYPKSKAGRRTVPLAPFAWEALVSHRARYEPGPLDEVFSNRFGELPKRTSFRVRVWRPSLVRAGLLGKVVDLDGGGHLAVWSDQAGVEQREEVASEAAAVEVVARRAVGGLRFHDPSTLVRDVAGVVRGADQRRAAGDGPRAGVDHARPLHAPVAGPPQPGSAVLRRIFAASARERRSWER